MRIEKETGIAACYGQAAMLPLWAAMTALTGILLLGGVAALAIGSYFFWPPRPAQEEVFYHFQCPACGRKLRFRARRAGKQGICPRCRKRCTYPKSSASAQAQPGGS